MRAAILGFFLLILPVASAVDAADLPGPVGSTERVAYFGLSAGDVWCDGSDDYVGLFSAIPSTVHTAAEGSNTRYSFHLEALPGLAQCEPYDISFVSPLAPWPGIGYTTTSVADACGLSGTMVVRHFEADFELWIDMSVPATCGFGIDGAVSLHAVVYPVNPSPFVVCAVTACVGVVSREGVEQCPNGANPEALYLEPTVVTIHRWCELEGDGDFVAVSVFPVLSLYADDSECRARVQLVVASQSVSCPEPVREVVYGTNWGGFLP